MPAGHRLCVEELLSDATAEHGRLLASLPAELRDSLPVDAQGVTRAIDHLAIAAGFSDEERRALMLPHSVNPAVLHARVFGTAPLTRSTVIGAFVDGARVRAEALSVLADVVGGEALGKEVRMLLSSSPPPLEADGYGVLVSLRATYAAQERAAVAIAASLDAT